MAAGRKWGPWLIGGFVAILLAVLGTELWQQHEESASRAVATQFATAQQQASRGDAAAVAAQFEAMSKQGPQVYRELAMMEHAAALQAQGDLQGAIQGFDAAAAATHDPILRDSARMRAAYLVADTQDFQAVSARLQPLIQAKGQFSYLAKELLAIEAWEAGQNDLARSTLQSLSLAFDAPDSVRQRAQLALTVLGPASTPAAATTPANAAHPANGETK